MAFSAVPPLAMYAKILENNIASGCDLSLFLLIENTNISGNIPYFSLFTVSAMYLPAMNVRGVEENKLTQFSVIRFRKISTQKQ